VRRAVPVLRQLAQRGLELGLGRRDERRLVGRDAGPQQRFARLLVRGPVGGQEVDPSEPVHLQVDEPRGGNSLAGTAVDADRGDPPVGDVDVATHERAVDERCLDSESRHVQPAARSSATCASTA
jgi:hypothetical protein